jgi:signal transduction histidine kinase/ActR/RegA family two-component response regulator
MESLVVEKTQTQLALLNDLMTIAGATKDVRDVLDQSLGALLVALQGEAGCAYLLTPERDGWQLAAHRGLAMEQLAPLLRLPLAEIPSKPVRKESMSPALSSAPSVAMACQMVLAIALVAHDETLGHILVGLRNAAYPCQVDREFLNTVGQAIGLAVDNSRLYGEMEQRLNESQALYKVSRALASTLDLDDLLNLIVHSAVDTIKAQNGVLHLLDAKTGELHPRALSFIGSVRPDVAGRSRMKTGQGVAGIAMETGQVVNIPDVSSDPRFIRVGKGRPMASMLVAPLKLGDRRVGTLSVDSNKINAFSPADERLLMTLAAQAAGAIEHARLVNDLQQSLLDLKATQAQLVQSEKLSAIGQLIAGVAHEMNNPLTAVMGYAQLLLTANSVDEDTKHDLNKIYFQAQRAAKIVQNLLTFARQHKTERQLVDVNEVVERTLELRSYQLRVENIEVTTQLAPHTLYTMADPGQLQQVFLNLINNAQDAMTACRGGGHLLVSTERQDKVIHIRFSDDGPGLSAEARRHLFEPFFTTKEVGKGTGLGLSICFGIVSQHGGRIWPANEPGEGATFVVDLPLAQADSAPWYPPQDTTVEATGGKRILVVEDEEDVASVIGRILSEDEHCVVLARDGEAALRDLAEAAERNQPFDLVISDIKMPGLSGTALYARLRQENAALSKRMIFVTGDTMNAGTQQFLKEANLPYLSKPFTINELRRAMLQILQEPR